MKRHAMVSWLVLAAACACTAPSCRHGKKKGGEEAPGGAAAAGDAAADAAAPAGDAVRRDPLGPGPLPALFVTQSRFLPSGDARGKKTKPGPARLVVLRAAGGGEWQQAVVDDPDSNVFHKAAPYGDGVLTAGAMGAYLKLWRFAGGAWTAETIWHPAFGGTFDRLRDFEIGNVAPGRGAQIVIATHDQGVVAVVTRTKEGYAVEEIDRQADTFVHEIELGDLDGDGIDEIYATPSKPNKLGQSQSGQVVRYRWNGKGFQKSVVDTFPARHAKEILVTRLLGDPSPTLFAVAEAELAQVAGKPQIVRPVEIVRYSFDKGGKATRAVVASIQDAQCRFLSAADFDGDGKTELVAAAMKTGLWLIRPGDAAPWAVESIDQESSGFEHALFPADLDGNGRPELYVAADEQGWMSRYEWPAGGGAPSKLSVAQIDDGVITWNITAGHL